ncbi:proline dehydrogenase family protein [Desertivirga brevis]|uniref:proline dehydrogenase family protein n=1 Tax=Desertivirga brevis TaxID=2810310 RepID=UPI001A97BEBE|nr:proline dehydrogenase family protein [Pedobacter sp. SYSU D00873]
MESLRTYKEAELSFDNTQTSFSYKSDTELKRAKWLFWLMSINWLVKLGTMIIPVLIKWRFPIKGIIKSTIFPQFVGGESLISVAPVLEVLDQYNVGAILDYGAEGKESETVFDKTCEEFLKVINFASNVDQVNHMSIKVTALARFDLLERISSLINNDREVYSLDLNKISEKEKEEWERVVKRLDAVCSAASSKSTAVLIDAEESWIQVAIDLLGYNMMQKYNTDQAIVFNTIQFYRRDRLKVLSDLMTVAKKEKFVLGLKIVRGAYQEKEDDRAKEKNYPTPIQPNKPATDSDFNAGMEFCLRNLDTISVIIATHNEASNLLAAAIIKELGLKKHPHVHFSQLFGMSDNITFNMASAGFSVSKYIPYGTVEEVIPYLLRRAQENTSVAGQTGRELSLIHRELERRKG